MEGKILGIPVVLIVLAALVATMVSVPAYLMHQETLAIMSEKSVFCEIEPAPEVIESPGELQ